MTCTPPSVDPVEVRRALGLLHPEGGTFETRILEVKDATWNGHRDSRSYPIGFGYFRDPGRAAQELSRVLGSARFLGIYTTLNPVRPELFSRAADELRPAGKKDSTTSDADVPRRRWILVDLDFKRPTGISTTDAEHEAALALARRIAQEITARYGWPPPVLADSGNGAHLLWQVSLPGDDGGLVKRVLARLQKDFAADGVDVDQTVFNSSRITKLYGTLAAKGSNTPERPHRMSRILEVPEDLRPVPSVLLEDYAGPAETATPPPPGQGTTSGWSVDEWVSKHLPEAKDAVPHAGGRKWILDPCPFDENHRGTSSALFQLSGGGLAFKCQHNGCAGRTWTDLRTLREGPRRTPAALPPGIPSPVLLRLADIEPEGVSWIWSGRIAKGKLTLLDGDPGTGKSTLALNLAAAISTGGILPGGDRVTPADVVILSAEDGAADTIRPRIDAAGGDPRRIHLLTAVLTSEGEEAPDLCSHIPIIRAAVERTKAALVIIDPLMAYLGPDVNSHRDQDIRRTLSPLSKMAEETGTALVVVRHLNKSAGGQAIYRGGGSIGIAGAARVVLLVAKDPEDEDRRILAVVKNNLAKFPESLAFRLQGVGHVARVEWDSEPVSYTADELLAVSVQDPDGQEEKTDQKTAKETAQEWLIQLLWKGPVPSKEIPAQIKEAGLSAKTVRRARESLGIICQRIGYGPDGGWEWRLPEPLRAGRNFETGERADPSKDAHTPAIDAQDAHQKKLGHLGQDWGPDGHLWSAGPEAGGVTSPSLDLEEEAV